MTLNDLNAPERYIDRVFQYEELGLEEVYHDIQDATKWGSMYLIVVLDQDGRYYGIEYEQSPQDGVTFAGEWEEYEAEVVTTTRYHRVAPPAPRGKAKSKRAGKKS